MKTRKNTKKIWKQYDEHESLEDVGKPTSGNISDNITNITNITNIISQINYDLCMKCNESIYLNNEGFYVCGNTKCGLIHKNILDQSAEWRYYGAEDNSSSDPTRCGMPVNPLLEESSYGCKVMCSGSTSYEMLKIKRYTEWQSMPYKEKSQYDEFQRITCMAQQGGIAKIIIDDAIRLHKRISEQQTFRGLNRDGIIAASIYISCRKNFHPRTAKEIANIFKLDATSATKGCKNAITIINNMEKDFEKNDKINLCNTTPGDFIVRFCSKLHINAELTKLCEFIAMLVEKQELIPENTPHSIAAGIIYLVIQTFELRINKKDINKVSGISEVTINKCYKKLETKRSSLIPNIILQKYGVDVE